MVEAMARNWWAVALRGLVALLFGLAAFLWPGLVLITLVLLFGFYALLDGIFALVFAVSNRTQPSGSRWAMGLLGVLGIVAGIATFVYPGITALSLLFLIAWWAVVTGVLEVVAAVQLRDKIPGAGEWLVGLSGVLSVLFGILLIANPGAGVLSVTWLIGVYAVMAGIALLVLGFRMRGMAQPLSPQSGTPR